MVSLLLSFPVYQDGKSFIFLFRWVTGSGIRKKSKLALAAELAEQAMKAIGSERQVILLCDSWYPKAEVAAHVEQFDNLEMVCNVRVDTAFYGLPPAKTGKKAVPENVETGFSWMRLFSAKRKAVTG